MLQSNLTFSRAADVLIRQGMEQFVADVFSAASESLHEATNENSQLVAYKSAER